MNADAHDNHWVKPLIAAGSLAYLAAAAVLIVRVGDPLFEPLHNYFPAFSWILSETDQARLAALLNAERWKTAMLYERLEIASVLLITYAAIVGICGALMKGRRLEISSTDLAAMVIGCFLCYALFTIGSGVADLLSNARLTSINLAAYPGVWFLAMVPATVLLAFTVGLLFHTAILRLLVPADSLRTAPEDDPVYF